MIHIKKVCGDCPSTSPCGDCNNCSPVLLGTYNLTIAGLIGIPAVWNGTYSMVYIGGCIWRVNGDPSIDPVLYWSEAGSLWIIQCYLPHYVTENCNFGSGVPCTLEGSYPGSAHPASTWTISAP